MASPKIPLHRRPANWYQNAASHDDNPEPFLARQRKRIAEADAARKAESAHVVTPIKRGSK